MKLFEKAILLLFVVALARSTRTSGVAESPFDYNLSLLKKIPKYVPNIEYLGSGYNIFFANPHSTDGQDPGYRNWNVFDFEYDPDFQKSLSADKSWIFPKGVRYNSYQACSITYNSKQIDSMQTYRQNLQVGVSVGADFLVGSFSVSADYKSIQENMQSQSSLFIESSAQCTIVEVGLYDTNNFHPLLSQTFVQALTSLEALGENEGAYHEFFQKFGTHVTSYAKLGSLFGYRFEMKASEAQKMNTEGFSIEASASIYLAVAKMKVEQKTEFEKTNEERFKSSLQTWKSFSTGALPNPENDVSKWAAQSIINPLPVSIELMTYETLLSKFTKRDKRGLADSQISNLKRRFSTYLYTYCQKYLVPKYYLTSCEDSNLKLNNIQKVIPKGFIEKLAYFKTKIQFWNIKSGKTLSPDPPTNRVRQTKNKGTDYYNWTLIQDGSTNKYQIKSLNNGKCICVQNRATDQNTPLELADCSSDYAQRFTFEVINEWEQNYRILTSYANLHLVPYYHEQNDSMVVVQIPTDTYCQHCQEWRIQLI